MENSKIAWTDHTFNPWIGCTKISAGCENCYAEADQDHRRHRVTWGKGQARSLTKTWGEPLKWEREAKELRTPKKIFCASLADVFDEEVPEDWRKRLFELIDNCQHLEWQILTKRTGFMRRFLDAWYGNAIPTWIWPGTTAENQLMADERLPILQEIPAAVLWVSVEPQIGPMNIEKYLGRINWVICGGESGEGNRKFDLKWGLSLRNQCRGKAAFFMKQLGGWPDKRDNPEEWPEDLRVREFPKC